MKILNLTQHDATADQIVAGVFEPHDKRHVQELLTFDRIPTIADISERCNEFVITAGYHDCDAVMIGGAPFFMPALQAALQKRGIRVLYAFSKRESVDEKQPDGSIKKIQVFRHAGFVEACD